MTGRRSTSPPVILRAVLDTNVYLSLFLFPESKFSPLWSLSVDRHYLLLTSPMIVRELMVKLRVKFGVSEIESEAIKKKLIRVAHIVQPDTLPNAVPDDPDDNHILACALEGKADIIVTGDRDLLRLQNYQGIPIVRPMDFLRTLGSSD